MRYFYFFIVAVPMLLLGCNSRSEPTPTATPPAAAPAATVAEDTAAAATPSETPVEAPVEALSANIDLALGPPLTTTITASSGFTVTLPPRWQLINFDDEALLAALEGVDGAAEDLRGAVELEGEQSEFVSLLLDETTLAEATGDGEAIDFTRIPSFHALRLPATGLMLNDYLQNTSAIIQSTGARLRSNQIRGDLRPDRELSVELIYEQAEQRSVQIAFLDAPASGERNDLIVLTFVAPRQRFEELLPTFEEIASSVELAE